MMLSGPQKNGQFVVIVAPACGSPISYLALAYEGIAPDRAVHAEVDGHREVVHRGLRSALRSARRCECVWCDAASLVST